MNNLQTKYKILTWNVLENSHYEQRIPLIAQFIRQSGADIVLLQETNDQFAELAVTEFAKNSYTLKLRPGSPTRGSISGVGIAYDHQKFQELAPTLKLSTTFRAMALDLLPIGKSTKRRPAKYISETIPHPDTPLDYGSDILTVISYHGHWGTFAQPERLNQVILLDQFAKEKGNAVILGGDFNALPNEPAIQYLLGNLIQDRQSTYWVESQALIEQLGGPRPYGTSFAHGQLVDQNLRFDLHRTPERRIDYLFNFGFSYGREYAFDGWNHMLDIDKARQLSDHAPLIAGILDTSI